ncbi:PAS domain S-box protein [Mucilaginibacter sp. HMF5004]|uniref:ATP-binding protein n=1 Tax=Mucilaginibacter rivuli TaxID=2857527 RepID=UPI001C6017FB|nr:ATP-binding protein [Mucilaginibacter rivuli]MBW4888199.1 PAS domain S-box protein [Mucilaginibacter rivuli]
MPRLTKKLSIGKSYINSPFYIKYGVPVLLLALVTLFKLWLAIIIGKKIAFMLYFGVVIIVSRYFGSRPAIVTSIIALFIGNYLFIAPYYTITLGKVELTQDALFILECSLIIGLSSALASAIKRVQTADRLFKALIEKSAEGIIMVNADGQTTYCSPAIEDILGYTAEEFLSFESWSLMHNDEKLDVKEEFYRLAGHPGKTIILQHRMKHKNNSWVWIESKTTNLLAEPAVNAIISNFSNITARITLEKQREDFIGVASHELKTPITSLKAYTQVLRARFKSNPDTTSYSIAKKMDQQVNHITRMITSLLDITTLQTGQLNLNITEFDINKITLEIIELAQQTTINHTIKASLTEINQITADKERIGQVITNFISNAIKYSPQGLEIQVTSEIKGRDLVFSVTDHGLGVSEKEQDKIFERFYRIDSSKNTFQGLGLGLYICMQIIKLHQGQIGVSSEEGKGSTFWFSLPLSAINAL